MGTNTNYMRAAFPRKRGASCPTGGDPIPSLAKTEQNKLNVVYSTKREGQLTGKAFLRKCADVTFGGISGISSIVMLGTRHAWKTSLVKYEYVAREYSDTVSSSFTSCQMFFPRIVF